MINVSSGQVPDQRLLLKGQVGSGLCRHHLLHHVRALHVRGHQGGSSRRQDRGLGEVTRSMSNKFMNIFLCYVDLKLKKCCVIYAQGHIGVVLVSECVQLCKCPMN